METKEPANDNRQIPAEPTPGPYEIRVRPSDFDPEIYSTTTGEALAHVYSRAFDRKDTPRDDEVTLKNATLMKAAPQLRGYLQTILETETQLRPATAKGVRRLLAEIDSGPGEAFRLERQKERKIFEDIIDRQIAEMARQSGREPFTLVEPADNDEEPGPSLDF